MKPQIWGKINKGASMIQEPISQFKRKKPYSLDWESGAKKLLGSLCPEEETSSPTACQLGKGSFAVPILQSHTTRRLPKKILMGYCFIKARKSKSEVSIGTGIRL